VVKLTKKKQIEAVLSALTQSSAKSESRDASKPAHAKTSASREGEAASEGK
jgi:hypothetical protein